MYLGGGLFLTWKERVLNYCFADDLARSLRDGRYGNQKCKMLKWRQSYINAGVSCNLVYLVEGKPEQYAVKCVDGCGAVLKCGYPTVSQIKVI